MSDELKGKSGIYKIVNLVNGKLYVGSTVNLYNRKSQHFSSLMTNCHKNPYLQNAFNKYGINTFKFEVLEYVEDVDKLIEREQYYLDIYFDNKNKCYNVLPTAGSPLGVKHSDETKLKLAITGGAKPFYVFKDREFIGEWINSSECSRNLDINYSGYIRKCLKGKQNMFNGYIFIYKDEYNEDKLKEIYEMVESKPFLVFEKYTENFIGEYDTINKCMIDLNINIKSDGDIRKYLKDKTYSVNNYIFIYKHEYAEDKVKELCNINLNAKPFYVYKKDDKKFVGKFSLQQECAKELNIDASNISGCLRKKHYFAKGYVFIYEEDYSEEKLNELCNKTQSLKFLKYEFEVHEKNTNKFIGIYDSQVDCANELGLNHKSISNCLCGKQISTGGYIFEKVS